MGWQVNQDTYVRTVRNDDGQEATVVYRHLSGYQKARLQMMRQGDEGGVEMDMGTYKARAISFAVVSWTIPIELSIENIQTLDDDVFERLFDLVSLNGVDPPERIDDPDVPLGDAPSSSPSGGDGEPTS